jgi:carboxymethylenebutenolidase
MERKKAGDFPPEVLKLFDGYVHGRLDRREFLDSAAKFAVGAFTATAMLESLKPNFAWAQQVPKDDKRIRIQYLDYDSPQGHGRMRGYFVQPAEAKGKLPAVLVIHENRGVNPYIEDVTRRLALANFVAFAPDALTPVGGYPGDEDKARALFAAQDAKKREEDLYQAAQVLKARPETTGKIGAVGFCFGGGICNQLAHARSGCLGALLRSPGTGFRGGEDQGALADPLRQRRREHQQGLAGVRRSAEGEQCALHHAYLSEYAARIS